MILRTCLFSLFLLSSFFLQSQSIHEVDDPDISFSIEVPQGWQVHDDGYMLAIVPAKGGTEYLDFTYYETDETDVDRAFEFSVHAFNGPNETDAEILNEGSDQVDGVKARWAEMSLIVDGVPHKRLIYLLVKEGQFFILRGHALPENYSFFKPFFEEAFRSLRIWIRQ